jgi:hypothetical protein
MQPSHTNPTFYRTLNNDHRSADYHTLDYHTLDHHTLDNAGTDSPAGGWSPATALPALDGRWCGDHASSSGGSGSFSSDTDSDTLVVSQSSTTCLPTLVGDFEPVQPSGEQLVKQLDCYLQTSNAVDVWDSVQPLPAQYLEQLPAAPLVSVATAANAQVATAGVPVDGEPAPHAAWPVNHSIKFRTFSPCFFTRTLWQIALPPLGGVAAICHRPLGVWHPKTRSET